MHGQEASSRDIDMKTFLGGEGSRDRTFLRQVILANRENNREQPRSWHISVGLRVCNTSNINHLADLSLFTEAGNQIE
jgi:hypothetical protein